MKVNQGDIVIVNYLFPNGKFKEHPVLVISNNDVNEFEDAFICVMLSSSAPNDNFSYWLTNNMINKPLKKPSQIRCNLISMFENNQAIQKITTIKKPSLKEIILNILTVSLSVDE